MNKETKVLFETKWIRVLESYNGFQYLERRGKDSVAIFVCRLNDLNKWEVLIRWQPLCIDEYNEKLYQCPVTGGYYEGKSKEETTQNEVLEEAGYKVELNELIYLGKYIAGTQTNETIYMYFVDVSCKEPILPEGDGSYFEKMSKNEWQPLDYLLKTEYSACLIAYSLIYKTIWGPNALHC